MDSLMVTRQPGVGKTGSRKGRIASSWSSPCDSRCHLFPVSSPVPDNISIVSMVVSVWKIESEASLGGECTGVLYEFCNTVSCVSEKMTSFLAHASENFRLTRPRKDSEKMVCISFIQYGRLCRVLAQGPKTAFLW